MTSIFTIITLKLILTFSLPEEVRIIQAVLDSQDLNKHFSYLPRYQSSGEAYYRLLCNELVRLDWEFNISGYKVKIIGRDELKNNESNFFMELKLLEMEDKKAKVILFHRYERLSKEENKFLMIESALSYREGAWVVDDMVINKICN